jgi:hypothetical protein
MNSIHQKSVFRDMLQQQEWSQRQGFLGTGGAEAAAAKTVRSSISYSSTKTSECLKLYVYVTALCGASSSYSSCSRL